MAITEIFPNPTVQKVIFQIRYPNLFFLENKIGDFQLKIIKEFPKSSLIIKKHLLLADVGSKFKAEELDEFDQTGQKIWQFQSENEIKLNVLNDSLDISSEFHKTYNNKNSKDKFRDIIKFVVDNFIEITSIPLIKRIGLRYIDECPLPSKNNKTIKEYYKTTFPINRFNLEETNEMRFQIRIKKNDNFLKFSEAFKYQNGTNKIILDFDGYTHNIESSKYLEATDELHDIILKEFENSIKEPVYNYMKNK